MKKVLLALAVVLTSSVVALAQQCAPENHPWTTAFGVSPDPTVGENFQPGEAGVPYHDIVYVKCPTSAADIDPTLPSFVAIDSVHLDAIFYGIVNGIDTTWNDLSVLGLALTCNNVGDSPDPCMFMAGGAYCGDITGTPNANGTYPVKIMVTVYINFFGPQSVPYNFAGYTLQVGPMGVAEINWNDYVTLAPNPANIYTLVNFPMTQSGAVNVNVYNTLGEVVSTEKVFVAAGANSLRLNTENLANGQYIVRLMNGIQTAEVLMQVKH
jgi:hypothetical protein